MYQLNAAKLIDKAELSARSTGQWFRSLGKENKNMNDRIELHLEYTSSPDHECPYIVVTGLPRSGDRIVTDSGKRYIVKHLIFNSEVSDVAKPCRTFAVVDPEPDKWFHDPIPMLIHPAPDPSKPEGSSATHPSNLHTLASQSPSIKLPNQRLHFTRYNAHSPGQSLSPGKWA